MKLLILPAFIVLFSNFAYADLIQDRVAKVLPGNSTHEETLILLADSGKVLRTQNLQTAEILASNSESTFSFVTDQEKILSYSLEIVPEDPTLYPYHDYSLPTYTVTTLPTELRYTDLNYIPTNLKNLSDAQKLMNNLRYNLRSKSECFQRAHLWSIEMLQMANIHSQKVFLFFTERYMREYRFHWWFHVAPFVLVNNEERVLDPQFFDAPADMQYWSNHFMPSHPVCKTISDFRDYDNHQEEEYCYLRKLPMYYFEPTEVENRDVSKTVISYWIDAQVASAYNSLNDAPWWKR